AKPEETLVEARSGSDVQIDRQIWQKLDKQFYEWAIFDTTKGVSSSRQQDGGHGSWNPLRSVKVCYKALRVILSGTTFSADLGSILRDREAPFQTDDVFVMPIERELDDFVRSGAFSMILEKPRERFIFTPGRTHNRSRSPRVDLMIGPTIRATEERNSRHVGLEGLGLC
ncbi:3358_t:CDS:2, partial [Funneliformis geosporum]